MGGDEVGDEGMKQGASGEDWGLGMRWGRGNDIRDLKRKQKVSGKVLG